MQPEIDDLVEKALQLPTNARASLAELLLESLDHEEDVVVSDEWKEEVRRRCKEIDEGSVELISADDALERLNSKYS